MFEHNPYYTIVVNEKEFQAEYLPALRDMLKFVLENPFSDFYKKKYEGLGISPESIKTLADYEMIPVLTKDELLSAGIDSRMFVPEEEIQGYTVSSGTTNINKPLITPIMAGPDFEYSEYRSLERNRARKVILLLPLVRAVGKATNMTVPFIACDPQKLELSAKIAKSFETDAIISTPTILYLFTKHLVDLDFDFSKVKQITVSTEYCTKQKADYFRQMYPQASLRISYGSSELGGVVGYRCKYLYPDEPNIFHFLDKCMVDFEVESDGEDAFGNMIYTHLTPKAFPLIKYRTGDIARKVTHKCRCGQDHLLYLKGKADLDVMRISGCLLYTQSIADALGVVAEYFEPAFQMHVYEVKNDNGIFTELVIELIAKKQDRVIDTKKLGRIIQDNLYLGADKTLTDFVTAGIFLPLKIRLVDSLPTLGKAKNIISHII